MKLFYLYVFLLIFTSNRWVLGCSINLYFQDYINKKVNREYYYPEMLSELRVDRDLDNKFSLCEFIRLSYISSTWDYTMGINTVTFWGDRYLYVNKYNLIKTRIPSFNLPYFVLPINFNDSINKYFTDDRRFDDNVFLLYCYIFLDLNSARHFVNKYYCKFGKKNEYIKFKRKLLLTVVFYKPPFFFDRINRKYLRIGDYKFNHQFVNEETC